MSIGGFSVTSWRRSGKIVVVGAGYIGLVVATCFAAEGYQVTCVDSDGQRINQLRSGHCPIYEPGLEETLQANTAASRLSFTSQLAEAVAAVPVILLCVGTPSLPDGAVDLSQVISATEAIGRTVLERTTVVVKSTVPLGTAERIEGILAKNSRHRCDVASVPEFVREGTAIADFTNPPRLVIGTRTEEAAKEILDLYRPFVRNHTRVILMDNRSAELAKYAANVALAARLSLINELAKLADAIGADIELIRRAIGADPRVGDAYMQPGIGFGGSCLPKDVRALARMSYENGVTPRMAEAILAVNNEQARWFVGKILRHFGNALADRRLTVWGLAFKPGTDDVRESVSLRVIEELLSHGAAVTVYDPRAMTTARAVLGDRVTYATEMYASLADADAIIVATEWLEFIQADWNKIKKAMVEPYTVVDGRNALSRAKLVAIGFKYIGVGV